MYVIGLFVAVGLTASWAVLSSPVRDEAWPRVIVFAAAIALGHLVYTPSRGQSYVLSGPFVVAAALVLPTRQAVFAVAVGLLPGELHTASPWYKKGFNYALYVGGTLLAKAVFALITPVPTLLDPRAMPAALTTSIAFTLTNLIAIALAVTLSQGEPVGTLLTPKAVLANLTIDGAGLAMAALWEASPPLLIFGIIPLVGGAHALWIPYLEEALRLDSKTGAYNARFAIDTLHRLHLACLEKRIPLSIILADLDNLREINNRCGHLIGDRALQNVAEILRTEVGTAGYVARFGGDEFVAMLPGRSIQDAESLAERARLRIRMTRLGHEQLSDEASMTISVGVSVLEFTDTTSSEALHRADLAMYQAKQTGRDRVVAKTKVPLTSRGIGVPETVMVTEG